MNHLQPRLLTAGLVLATAAFQGVLAPATAQAQDPVPRLQRESNEILRKIDRLQELMKRLLARYERDGQEDKARLLREGLAHLDQSRVQGAASAVRKSLDNGAFDDALRDQATVIEELDRLLDVLLERQTVENLEEQIEQTEELIAGVDELIRRQAELREQADAARDSRSSAAERAIVEAIERLASQTRAEATENERQAGLQMPVLESAIERLQGLLRAQAALEEGAQRQFEGAPDPRREIGFELGAIEQEQRDLMAQRGLQRDLERVAQAADTVEEAARNGDAAADDQLREAYDRLRAKLQAQLEASAAAENPARPGASEAQAELRSGLEELEKAPPGTGSEETREAMRAAAEKIANAAKQAAKSAAEANDKAQAELADRAKAAADATKEDRDGKPRATPTSRALDVARRQMEQSNESSQKGDTSEAMSENSAALRALSEARRQFRDSNPNPTTRASDMASGAEQIARDLRRSPTGEQAEKAAADALEQTRDALREAGQKLADQANGEPDVSEEQVQSELATSRNGIEQAIQQLQGAMQSALQGRDQEMSGAQQRQQDLQQQAEQAADQVEQAEQRGDITPEQADAAKRAMDQAQKSMQQAGGNLQKGQQSSAARDQRNAADALDKAAEAVEKNRPVTPEERAAMQDVAKQQEELRKDIIDLAKLAEERQNQKAQDALDRASEAADKARQALEDGEPQEAAEQQEEAQQQLENARDELEEERDRYLDLRQEELLFKIGEELEEFLEEQRALTAETAEFGVQFEEHGRLSRPARRKLNQIGEAEAELAKRTEFIVKALAEEGVLVFTHSLQANLSDLNEVIERLSGRSPDPGSYTQMLQADIESRAEKLLAALAKERERRRQERENQQQQNQQQNQGQNRQEPLVPLIAELQMLRQMEEDMRTRTQQMQHLLDAAGADGVTEFDLALSERLAHQHAELTKIFQQIRAAIEQSMQQGAEDENDPFAPPKEERNR